MLLDRGEFPGEMGCFESNKGETLTMSLIVKGFEDRHGVNDMILIADAGMLSAGNLTALDDAWLRFIVGSLIAKDDFG